MSSADRLNPARLAAPVNASVSDWARKAATSDAVTAVTTAMVAVTIAQAPTREGKPLIVRPTPKPALVSTPKR